jgi:hypothetical protein
VLKNNECQGHFLDAGTAVARYANGERGAQDEAMGIILSDAIDGVVHNAARRGTLATAGVRGELVRMIVSYLVGPGASG